MESLKNKRILLFSQYFFGYEKKIVKKMEEMGAMVDCFDERSVKTAMDRALLKVSKNIFNKKTELYYNSIMSNVRDNSYDYIVFIDCEMISEETIEEYKNVFTKAKFCLYLWDSVANLKGVENKFHLFDYVSSFDAIDCEKYKISFRPLFFCDEYREAECNADVKYDMCFIGTIHSDRYSVIRKISEKYSDKNLFIYPFLQSKFIYYFYKLTKKEFSGTKRDDFRYKALESSEIADIVSNSKAVIDIQHPKQVGLTMRTLEMLGMRKKFITTNSDIKNYDFYNQNNICIIDRKNPVIDRDFFISDYQEIEENVYEYYSINRWILDVLDIT